MSKVGKALKTAAKAAVDTRSTAPQRNVFRTQIEAKCASAGPPLGPLLGKTGIPVPVTVRVKPDRTYILEMHTPPVEYYVMQAAGINRGKCEGDVTPSGKLTIKHIYEIAKIKHEDPYERYQLYELDQVVNRVKLIAENLGILVLKDLDPDEYDQFLKARFAYLEELDKKLEEERLAKLHRT